MCISAHRVRSIEFATSIVLQKLNKVKKNCKSRFHESGEFVVLYVIHTRCTIVVIINFKS